MDNGDAVQGPPSLIPPVHLRDPASHKRGGSSTMQGEQRIKVSYVDTPVIAARGGEVLTIVVSVRAMDP